MRKLTLEEMLLVSGGGKSTSEGGGKGAKGGKGTKAQKGGKGGKGGKGVPPCGCTPPQEC